MLNVASISKYRLRDTLKPDLVNPSGGRCEMKKPYMLAMLGSGIEYYDIALYGYLAPVLIQVFLPNLEKTTAYFFYFLFEFFAAIAQYFGARYYGKRGDLYGRKDAICKAMIGTSIATFVVCLLPTYQQIGIIATLLFCCTRIMQSFFLGGEYNGGAIYCLEHETNSSNHGLISGMYCAFTVVGIIMASIIAAITNFFGAQYFRFAYAISFIFMIAIFYGRKKLQNDGPPAYDIKLVENAPTNLPSAFIMVVIASLFFGMVYGLPTKIFNAMLPIATGIDSTKLMLINSFFLILYMLLLILFGYIANTYKASKIMYGASIITTLVAYPLCSLLQSGSITAILISKAVFALLAAVFIAPFHTWAQNLFPSSRRYRGISMAYTTGKCMATIGLAASFLVFENSHNLKAVGAILLCVSLITNLVLYETKKSSKSKSLFKNVFGYKH